MKYSAHIRGSHMPVMDVTVEAETMTEAARRIVERFVAVPPEINHMMHVDELDTITIEVKREDYADQHHDSSMRVTR